MKRRFITTSAAVFTTCLCSHAAIVWSGGGASDDFYDVANWDLSGSASTAMSSPTDDIVTITGATINAVSYTHLTLPTILLV